MAIEGYDLHDRIFMHENPLPISDPDYNDFPLGGHKLYAVLVEYAEGESSRPQIISALKLGTEATVDLDAVLTAMDATPTVLAKIRFAVNFDAVQMIANYGYKYTDKASFKTRLGL